MDLKKLRELASGHVEWFAMGTDEKSYFISFSTEWNAVRWMDDQKKRMPEWVEREGVHLVKQHVFSELQELANVAASEIETLHAVLQDIMTEDLIPDGYPLLMARAEAALDGGGA